jgi:hypothetical protein
MKRKAADRWAATHWLKDGDRKRNSVKVIDYPDALFPDTLVGMGKLIEFHVKPSKGREVVITFPKGCILAFTMDKAEHLYPCLTAATKADVRARYWREGQACSLRDYMRHVGGFQAKFPAHHPNVQVTPIGTVTHVVYETYKEGDDYSQYIHEFGEESGTLPHLAADSTGRLWVVGGNYTTPVEGITD